jgi:hypothetical protein
LAGRPQSGKRVCRPGLRFWSAIKANQVPGEPQGTGRSKPHQIHFGSLEFTSLPGDVGTNAGLWAGNETGLLCSSLGLLNGKDLAIRCFLFIMFVSELVPGSAGLARSERWPPPNRPHPGRQTGKITQIRARLLPYQTQLRVLSLQRFSLCDANS